MHTFHSMLLHKRSAVKLRGPRFAHTPWWTPLCPHRMTDPALPHRMTDPALPTQHHRPRFAHTASGTPLCPRHIMDPTLPTPHHGDWATNLHPKTNMAKNTKTRLHQPMWPSQLLSTHKHSPFIIILCALSCSFQSSFWHTRLPSRHPSKKTPRNCSSLLSISSLFSPTLLIHSFHLTKITLYSLVCLPTLFL